MGPHDTGEDISQESGGNVFMHENRMANTLNRGQQQSVQSQQQHQSMPLSENIFGVVQQPMDGSQGTAQQMYTANNMQGYMASKQLQGVQTPSGFK